MLILRQLLLTDRKICGPFSLQFFLGLEVVDLIDLALQFVLNRIDDRLQLSSRFVIGLSDAQRIFFEHLLACIDVSPQNASLFGSILCFFVAFGILWPFDLDLRIFFTHRFKSHANFAELLNRCRFCRHLLVIDRFCFFAHLYPLRLRAERVLGIEPRFTAWKAVA